MNKYGYIIFFFLLCSGLHAVWGRQNKVVGKKETATQAAAQRRYIFHPETIYPVGGNARQATPGFELRFSKDSIFCYLPYFGRAYNIPNASRDGALDFTTTDFDFKVRESGKKEQVIILAPREQRDVREINITLYSGGGYAYVQVLFSQRQHIAYRGQMLVEQRP